MTFGNVTVPPLAFAASVRKPEIKEVLDLETGEFLNSATFISSHRYQNLIAERNRILERIQSADPRYACSMCQVAVYLCATSRKKFFFRHRVEDGSCPAQTRSPLSYDEICARKYHGLRESKPHQRLKLLIQDSLTADPSFSDVAVEKTWRAAEPAQSYRRPDVQGVSGGRKFAFEVQLSTTFLSVVVGRKIFYRDEGALLIWVLGSFHQDYRRLTTDDLLFSNNSNVFVTDEETLSLSKAAGAFHLRCFYRVPIRRGSEILDEWREELVKFADLSQDQETQQIYYFDYATAERDLQTEIIRERLERASREAARKAQELEDGRQSFLAFWRAKGRYFEHTRDALRRWAEARTFLVARGLDVPVYPDSDAEFRAMLNALLSVEDGEPVGWEFKRLVEVAHHLLSAHPRQLLAFGYALRLSEREALVLDQDASGKWGRKRSIVADRLRKYDHLLMPEERLLPHLRLLFPNVAVRVDAYLRRARTSCAA